MPNLNLRFEITTDFLTNFVTWWLIPILCPFASMTTASTTPLDVISSWRRRKKISRKRPHKYSLLSELVGFYDILDKNMPAFISLHTKTKQNLFKFCFKKIQDISDVLYNFFQIQNPLKFGGTYLNDLK